MKNLKVSKIPEAFFDESEHYEYTRAAERQAEKAGGGSPPRQADTAKVQPTPKKYNCKNETYHLLFI